MSIDIHQQLLKASIDQAVNVCTVRQWVMHLSSDESVSPLLVQVFSSAAFWLLFVAKLHICSSENAEKVLCS